MQEAGAHRHGLLRTDAVSGGEPPRGKLGQLHPIGSPLGDRA